jgi:antitoxin MazE
MDFESTAAKESAMETAKTQVRLERWGNSLVVRIPQEIVEKAELTQDCLVNLEVQGDIVRVERTKVPYYELEDLLAGMTPDQVHPEIDTGPPVGEEIW